MLLFDSLVDRDQQFLVFFGRKETKGFGVVLPRLLDLPCRQVRRRQAVMTFPVLWGFLDEFLTNPYCLIEVAADWHGGQA
jgi:hypothetical protein